MQLQRYLGRISGPLLDRFDIQIDVPPLKSQELLNENFVAEPSSQILRRIVAARKVQIERYRKYRIYNNAQLPPRLMKQFCALSSDCLSLMEKAIRKYHLSARAYHRVLKVARTIADLEAGSTKDAAVGEIAPHQLAEAIQYRSIDQI